MKTLQARARSLATSLVISVLAVLTVACGSSNDDFTQVSGQQGGPIGGSNFVGQFLGANNLPNNQTADLSFTVNNNGGATGTLSTNAAIVTQAVQVGDFPVTGQVNLNSGTFTLTGNIPSSGNFTITGVLPVGNNQGTYQLVINGQTFQGVVQPANLGAPNAPGNNTPPPEEDGRLISGGTVSNFVFTPGNGYNGPTQPVDADSTIAGAVGTGEDGQESVTIGLTEVIVEGQTATIRALVITIVDEDELVEGQAYPLSTDGKNGSVISLSDSTGSTVTAGWSIVDGTTGQATITNIGENSITVQFQFTNVGPNSEVDPNDAEGEFSTSGTITGNFITLP